MDLSILIPARNEMFLKQTIDNILAKMEGDTEVIAVLDGAWADPPIEDHPRVTLIYHSQSIGQRAATNEAARYSNAKYVMKCDAHCAFDQGFDVKLMKDCEKDWTVIPRMYNLHAFDWKCKVCGNRTYQGPWPEKCFNEKCTATGKENFERFMVWEPRRSRETDFMRFDNTLHFQYWGSYKKRKESEGEISDLMCFVGACFFMHRDRYWELGGLDEKHGSWGQMGVEMSCKSWLSGGRLVINKKTWFSHLFRTQPGFGFPYPNPGIERARSHSRSLWFENKWPLAKYPLKWMLNKFMPIPDWTDEMVKNLPDLAGVSSPKGLERPSKPLDVAMPVAAPPDISEEEESKAPAVFRSGNGQRKGIVYYTDNKCDQKIAEACRVRILKCVGTRDIPIISVSLKPIPFGDNYTLPLERGVLTMFKQILTGIENAPADILFMAEHDLLYHPSHYDFTPPRKDVYYYNENTWKVDALTGQALFYYTKQTSGLCAYKELLLGHYKRRVEKVEKDGFSRHMGFEPGCHSIPRGVDNFKAERWMAPFPNIDIRHNTNLTPSRWSQDQFRNKNSCLGWTMADEVPGWGVTRYRFWEFLNDAIK